MHLADELCLVKKAPWGHAAIVAGEIMVQLILTQQEQNMPQWL